MSLEKALRQWGKTEKSEISAFSALLTDLLKTFNFMPHDLIIAKLPACGFEKTAFGLIFSLIRKKE